MKIIRRGRRPAERKWRGSCNACNSQLEATEAELTVQGAVGPRPDDGPIGRAPCPACSHEVIFYPQGEGR